MILFIFFLCMVAAFALGVLLGPQVHAMIKTCQDDVVNSGEGRGGLGSCFPKTKESDLKYDPLIGPGDYWQPAKRTPSKRKGKRKGK